MRGAKETLQAPVGRLCVLADLPALQDRQVRHHPGPAFVFDRILEYKTGNKQSKSSTRKHLTVLSVLLIN